MDAGARRSLHKQSHPGLFTHDTGTRNSKQLNPRLSAAHAQCTPPPRSATDRSGYRTLVRTERRSGTQSSEGNPASLARAVWRAPPLTVETGLLLLGAKLEVLAALDRELGLLLALAALHTQRDLLCGLRLLVENGLRLSTETALLPVVPPLACEKGSTRATASATCA